MREHIFGMAVIIGSLGLLILALKMPNLVVKGEKTVDTRLDKAIAMMRARDYGAAAAEFAEAEAAGADVVLCRRRRAECLFQSGRYDDAISLCMVLETTTANEPVAPYLRGRCLEALDRKSEALEAYRTAAMRDEPMAKRRLAKVKHDG